MRVIYMGTPDFAVAPLLALAGGGADVALCVTKPDRPSGRGKKMQSCPVKKQAQALGIPVLSPEKIKGDPDFLRALSQAGADLIVVAAYGKILPAEVLALPRLGCVNIHASLLPRYRGAAPVQRAIMAREEETGVTLMDMAEQLDSGDILAQAATPVGEKTASQLLEELSHLGADLLMEQLPLLANGRAVRTPQDSRLATYAPRISKEEMRLDFRGDPRDEAARVRALTGVCLLRGEPFKIHEAHAEAGSCDRAPGTVLSADPDGIRVSCGGGVLVFTRVQLPGKKAMEVSAFLRGNQIEKHAVLG